MVVSFAAREARIALRSDRRCATRGPNYQSYEHSLDVEVPFL